ncbi:hypothetical protein QWI17_22990 [Gilvimarinus sp. SDUM040013]|uniref:Uncharacterized protein n=1 Tax=Gilvimarinus gilvus TaxID=3058038 RepID=A0ABU4RXK6_9GAMM|nr:hypothetical protein [Gilvimarinus sp. SDUM040013]MDO3388732.1 hypothetical protein [Gilvimarinus sp. SDUM040013]MDX6849627.1 hypothetical protein [Gilvimarinus sp. SDUM040013]
MQTLADRFITEILDQWPQDHHLPQQVAADLGYCYHLSASIEGRVPVAMMGPQTIDSRDSLAEQIRQWIHHVESWIEEHHPATKGWIEVHIKLAAQANQESGAEFTVAI